MGRICARIFERGNEGEKRQRFAPGSSREKATFWTTARVQGLLKDGAILQCSLPNAFAVEIN